MSNSIDSAKSAQNLAPTGQNSGADASSATQRSRAEEAKFRDSLLINATLMLIALCGVEIVPDGSFKIGYGLAVLFCMACSVGWLVARIKNH